MPSFATKRKVGNGMLSSSTKATSQTTCSPMNIGDGFTPPSPVPENACISLISMIRSFKEIEYRLLMLRYNLNKRKYKITHETMVCFVCSFVYKNKDAYLINPLSNFSFTLTSMSSVIALRSYFGAQPHSSRAQVSSMLFGQLSAMACLTGSIS